MFYEISFLRTFIKKYRLSYEGAYSCVQSKNPLQATPATDRHLLNNVNAAAVVLSVLFEITLTYFE